MATRSLAHPAPTATRFRGIAWSLLALWLVAWLAGPSLVAAVGVSIHPQGHAHLHVHGHPFVDAGSWWGVPNSLDVLSNLPLVFVGGMGLAMLSGRSLPAHTASALRMFLVGLVLSGLGSAIYHWAPDPATLVVDRLGMAVAFAGALGVQLWMLIAAYALAKLLELGDETVYRATGEWVSGHSL